MTRFMSRLAFLTPRMSWRLVLVATLALAPVIVPATAQAHGEGETQEGYLLVQQAG